MDIQALFTDMGTEIPTSAFFNELGNREIIVATYNVVALHFARQKWLYNKH